MPLARAEWEEGMGLSIVPLHPALGAEIRGLDLATPADEATIAAIAEAFDKYIVLVFRGQDLSEAAQLRAAGYFGRVAHRRRPLNGSGPGGDYESPFMLVSNIVTDGKPIGAFGDGEMWFHHDTSYYPEPHRATLLYALKLPSLGGNTRFSNMYRAYDNIPRPLRDRLEGRKVLQMHDYKRRERIDLASADLTRIRHHEQPLFVSHPATGRKTLYVSRLMSAAIIGLPPEESAGILDELFDISEDSSIVFEHEWKLGDLVIWDNWCSIHARRDFPRDQQRLLRRLTIEGQALHF
jgi:taurine dioxygenase